MLASTTKEFEPHQKRVVEERGELNTKLEALRTFIRGKIFQSLDQKEQQRLKRQRSIMTEYLHILDARIRNF